MARKSTRKKYKVIDMITKKKLPQKPLPRFNVAEEIPIKVRRSLSRRRSNAPIGAIPIGPSPLVMLSPLYRRDIDTKYIDQIFMSKIEIGRGSFGNVYQVMSRDDSRQYAVKVTNDKRSVVHRGEVLRMLKFPTHKHCIQFFNGWEEDCRVHIQMELCKINFETYLDVYHALPEHLAWEIFVDIALGLQHLHNNQLIHLDIKPSNIMITESGVCKLGDFGLLVDTRDLIDGKFLNDDGSEGDSKYVALEVLCEETYTMAADIFSFGLLMMETLSDVALPKSGPTWELLRNGVEPHCYRRRRLSLSLRSLIRKMIQKSYEKRPKIDEVLKNYLAVRTMKRRNDGKGLNIMSAWNEDYPAYIATLPHPDEAVPVIEYPSPVAQMLAAEIINSPNSQIRWPDVQ
ncbi:hypothetical protein RI129_012165 [Pyrocoelia pectoralis]|uniref:non-specific serine/threonine protein kinase n=1 Tax=Pyrocoelia pectoralis TaxID=417401 RepID=A0AAN7V3C6_9COLE